jgi:hypothetical protein
MRHLRKCMLRQVAKALEVDDKNLHEIVAKRTEQKRLKNPLRLPDATVDWKHDPPSP